MLWPLACGNTTMNGRCSTWWIVSEKKQKETDFMHWNFVKPWKNINQYEPEHNSIPSIPLPSSSSPTSLQPSPATQWGLHTARRPCYRQRDVLPQVLGRPPQYWTWPIAWFDLVWSALPCLGYPWGSEIQSMAKKFRTAHRKACYYYKNIYPHTFKYISFVSYKKLHCLWMGDSRGVYGWGDSRGTTDIATAMIRQAE